MFERFSDQARRVLVLAQEEARMMDHRFIGTEHLLAGLIREGDGIAAKALEALGVSLEAVRDKVQETREEPVETSETAPNGSPPFTPRAKKVLELSLREASRLGHSDVGTEHLLLGLAREGQGEAVRVLARLGADLSRVRAQVFELTSGLHLALVRLLTEHPGALQNYPMLAIDEDRQPPFHVGLAPWAAEIAGELDRDFGDDLDLTVGFLRYPSRSFDPHTETALKSVPQIGLLASLDVSFDDPVVVRSGYSTHSSVRIHNHRDQQIVLKTNGTLTARIVDPGSGDVVGGFSGLQHLPGVPFSVRPHFSTVVPLVVGTASVVPQLGYAVPVGEWALDAVLDVHGLGRYRTPRLPVAIVP
jgi:hypothetical protein